MYTCRYLRNVDIIADGLLRGLSTRSDLKSKQILRRTAVCTFVRILLQTGPSLQCLLYYKTIASRIVDIQPTPFISGLVLEPALPLDEDDEDVDDADAAVVETASCAQAERVIGTEAFTAANTY